MATYKIYLRNLDGSLSFIEMATVDKFDDLLVRVQGMNYDHWNLGGHFAETHDFQEVPNDFESTVSTDGGRSA